MTLCLLAAFCIALAAPLAAQPAPNPRTAVISAADYERQLERAAAQLQLLEKSSRRSLQPVLSTLARPQTVRRADGATLTVSGHEWKRYAERGVSPRGNATRAQVRAARAAVLLHLQELRAWKSANFAPSDAQGIVRQLENTGQIRTGPTRWEQWKADFVRGVKAAWRRLTRWMDSILPTAPLDRVPTINPKLIETLFYATVGALVLLLFYLLWRAVGGQLGRRGARHETRHLSGEDAELLRLPPDELRERAHRFAREGNFREALRHRFIALLVTLDARGVWRYDTHRTNWEHIAALRARSTPLSAATVETLAGLTRRFDRVRYGNAACNREEWQQFDSTATKVETATTE